MGIDRGELRQGLTETRRFLLAHHHPSEFYRCYSPVVRGRTVHICARCLGVYPGILAGIVSYFIVPRGVDPLALVAIFPAPTLVDWLVTTFRDRRGYNAVRTATGALLGYGYGLGIALLVFNGRLAVLAVGIVYAVVAALLLYHSW